MVSAGFASVLTMPVVDNPLAVMDRRVLTVGASGEFETANLAMAVASPGDTVLLGPGTFDEKIIFDKPVLLSGTVDEAGNLVTQITTGIVVITDNYKRAPSSWGIENLHFKGIKTPALGQWSSFGWNSAAITTMPWGTQPTIADMAIQGLKVRGCQFEDCWQGMYLTGCQGAYIYDCTFRECYRGITIREQYANPSMIWPSFSNRIEDCYFYDSLYKDQHGRPVPTDNGEGIAIFDSDDNRVINCDMDGNTYGIHVYKGNGNIITGNTIKNSTVAPLSFREVTQTLTVTNNIVDEADGNKPIWFDRCYGFTFKTNSIDGATLTLVNSTKGDIDGNTFEKTRTPALKIGTLDHHFDHTISKSNTIGGEPIYYYHNEPRVVLRDRDVSAVYIMNCSNSLIASTKVIEGDGIVVHRSDGLVIEDTTVTNNIYGIDILDSDDLEVRTTTTDTGDRGRYAIHLENVTNAYIEDSEIRVYGPERSLYLEDFSECHIHNSTFDGTTVQARRNGGGYIKVTNELNVRVLDHETFDPFQGAHVLVTEDSQPVYATSYYGGEDDVTRLDGMIRPITLTDRVYDHSNSAIEHFHSLQAWAEVDGSWAESRPNLDMSETRLEVFEVSDIWAPGAPRDVQVEDLPSEDAIRVTWSSPLDVDAEDVTLYWDGSGEWEELVTMPATNTFHKVTSGLVHGVTYNFKLTTWDTGRLESLPTPTFGVVHVDGVTPPAPVDLLASNITAFSCELDWTKVTHEDVVGYHVYINDTGVGPTGPWVKVTSQNGVASNLYQVNGLTSETTYFFAVSAFDEVPNESPHSPTIKVETPDVTPPGRPLLDELPPFTNQAQQTVTGTSEAGATVTIYLNGEEVGSAVADEDEVFEVEVELAEGPNSILARATDPSGNVGMFSHELVVNLDTVTPDAPVLDELPAITGKVTLTVSGTAEGASTVTIFVDDEEAASTESIMYVGFSTRVTLMEGKNTITALATDRALNVGPKCDAVEVVLDTVPPLEPELDELPTITAEPELDVSGVAEPKSMVEVYLGEFMAGSAQADEVGRFSIDIELLEGHNFLSVRAIDAALNPSRATLPKEIVLDTIPPVVYVGENVTAVEDTEVTFDGSTSYDNEGISNYVWTFTVGTQPQTMEGDVITYTFEEPMEVYMKLTATDVAGNSDSATMLATIVTSNLPPELTLGKIDPPEGHTGTTFTFDVTFTDPEGISGTVTLVLDGKRFSMTADPSDHDASDGVMYTYSTELDEGDHKYYFEGIDDFGYEANGPCVGSENERTFTVYAEQKAGVPGMGAFIALGALGLVGAAITMRRRRQPGSGRPGGIEGVRR